METVKIIRNGQIIAIEKVYDPQTAISKSILLQTISFKNGDIAIISREDKHDIIFAYVGTPTKRIDVSKTFPKKDVEYGGLRLKSEEININEVILYHLPLQFTTEATPIYIISQRAACAAYRYGIDNLIIKWDYDFTDCDDPDNNVDLLTRSQEVGYEQRCVYTIEPQNIKTFFAYISETTNPFMDACVINADYI